MGLLAKKSFKGKGSGFHSHTHEHSVNALEGWETRYKNEYKKPLSLSDAKKIHESRSIKAQTMDESKTAKKILKAGTYRANQYVKTPNRYDIEGVDTKKESKKYPTGIPHKEWTKKGKIDYNRLTEDDILINQSGSIHRIVKIKKEGVPANWKYTIQNIKHPDTTETRPLSGIEIYYKVEKESARKRESEKEPFEMTKNEFKRAPRNQEFVAKLKDIPKRKETKEELKAKDDIDTAHAKISDANLLWALDHRNQVRNMPKSKQKLFEKLDNAWKKSHEIHNKLKQDKQDWIHKQVIIKAQNEGKEIPEEVLDQYPDLEAKKTKPIEKDQIKGGLADNQSYSKYNKKQLEAGTKVEMEHTNDPKIAKEIASDHLEEIPDYYTRLNKMEKEAEKDKGDKSIEIDNIKASGRIASGFKYTVLEGQKTEDGGIVLGYSEPYYQEYKHGKMNDCTMTLDEGIGFVGPGYAKKTLEWYGKEQIEKAKYIEGKTYAVKDELKKVGFKWNPKKQRWEK